MVTELLEKQETNADTERKLPYFLLTNEVKELLRFDSITAFNNFLANTDDFPKHIVLGLRKKAYVRDEVIDWLNKRLAQRGS